MQVRVRINTGKGVLRRRTFIGGYALRYIFDGENV